VSRGMDSWIAGLCNFDANWANEKMLLAMRTELLNRAHRDSQRIEAARQALDRLADAASAETGAELIAKRMAPLEAAIAQAESRARKIDAVLADYAARRDPRYRKAHELVSASLHAHSIDALVAQARRTPGAEDDQLVLEIIALQDKLAGCRRDGARVEQARQAAEADVQRAVELEQEMQRGGYCDGARVQYGDDLNLRQLVGRYMNGDLSLGALARELEPHVRVQTVHSAYQETQWGRQQRG